jgi:GT2 family glycosyltransferase
VEDFCSRHPLRFRYLFEGLSGKSYALNTGIRAAKGDILAFTDDDVTFEPAWLRSLTAHLMDGQWAGAGGRTLPTQPFSPPDWLSAKHPIRWGGTLGGLFDLGDQPAELRVAPYGNNMAFRRQMFEKYGGFRLDLGRRPGSLLSCEDTEFGNRLLAGGEHLRYEPSAIVYHPIVASRLQKAYFLAWWFDYGRSQTREKGEPLSRTARTRIYLKTPVIMGSRLLVRALRWMRCMNRAQRFFYKCQVWMTFGQIMETYHH